MMLEPQKLRLAIDAHMVGERETGNETYTLNLVKSLLGQFTQHVYYIFTTHREHLKRHLPANSTAHLIDVPSNPLRRIPFTIPNHVRNNKLQLLHVNYIAPPRLTCPIVVTIHDVSYDLYPRFFSLRDRLLLSTLVPFTMKQAAAIIAVSKKTRDDLIERYHIPPQKITVTYEGADSRFHPLNKADARAFLGKTYGIHQDFILTLGNLQPRKNISRLIHTFARLKHEQRLSLSLVIVGQALWRGSEVYQVVKDRGLESEVVFTGYVPDEHLPVLYNAAQLFVFPSLYEGFGLPLLEAMACGTPVVCSNISALAEIVGDAALTFDPCSMEDMAKKILQVLSSPELQSSLSKKGTQKACQFSWETMACQTLEVYQQVIDKYESTCE
jgi:glycosyltransferase involved in cell wall biosynthesis